MLLEIKKYLIQIFTFEDIEFKIYFKESSNSLYLMYSYYNDNVDFNKKKLELRKLIFKNFPTLGLIISNDSEYFTEGYNLIEELKLNSKNKNISNKSISHSV